ncbi:MAG: hypothetical protein ACRCZP_05225, partial [Phycicoccus sp.]
LALRYPALTDTPNGPLLAQNLALDAETWLNRAFPCTSTTRPASPGAGMMIRESDTGKWLGWTGVAWEEIGGAAGGGGAATVVADAQYSASANQSIGQDVDVVVAFGAAQITSPNINRFARSVGHEFELTVGGVWAISATVRYPFFLGANGELRARLFSTASATDPVAETAFDNESSPATMLVSTTRRFPAGARVYITTFNSSGVNRSLDRGTNGSTVRINIALVGR